MLGALRYSVDSLEPRACLILNAPGPRAFSGHLADVLGGAMVSTIGVVSGL
jgi:hypothetical protein